MFHQVTYWVITVYVTLIIELWTTNFGCMAVGAQAMYANIVHL